MKKVLSDFNIAYLNALVRGYLVKLYQALIIY